METAGLWTLYVPCCCEWKEKIWSCGMECTVSIQLVQQVAVGTACVQDDLESSLKYLGGEEGEYC